jgi:ADP-heptose:LPS heptosyltransferase
MPALVVAPAKLGDFIQGTALFAGLKDRGLDLILLCTQKSVAQAAGLTGLFDEIICLAPDELSVQALPLSGLESVYSLSMSPIILDFMEKIKAQKPEIYIFGPQIKDGQIAYPPAQAMAHDFMAINRRLSPFNLVDIWCRIEPGKVAKNCLFWPKTTDPDPLDKKTGEPIIGLVLGAGHLRRRWPRENFKDLADCLIQDLGAKIILLGSKTESALGKAIVQNASDNPHLINLTGQTDLKALGEIIGSLNLLISADTGVMHLAAALETPVLSLFFGPAQARETGPYGTGHHIIQSTGPCWPCAESAPCSFRRCEYMPTVEAAIWAVKEIFKNQGKDSNLEQLPKQLAAPGLELYETVLDNFGYKLKPLNQGIASEQWQAALIRESACALVDPLYCPQKLNPEVWDIKPKKLREFWAD